VLLKRLAPFLLAFVLPLLVVYAWWGGFNTVELRAETRGPYTYAYLDHEGDYGKLPDVQLDVRKELDRQHIPPGLGITVLYSNPDLVPRGARKARTGYLLNPGTQIAAPLKVDTIPARQTIVSRVQASVLLAPSRAYLALDHHLQQQGRGIVMPTVEIYQPAQSGFRMGVLTVEMNAR
jgi:hypothetical protein